MKPLLQIGILLVGLIVLTSCVETPQPATLVTDMPTLTQPTKQAIVSDPTATQAPIPTPLADTPTPEEPAPATIPDPVGTGWTLVVNGLSNPVDLTHAGDGSGRLFILEQEGVVRVIRDQTLQSEPFLDIRDRVGSGGNEQGLLGIAFHPKFQENGYFYINYTDKSGDTVIARYNAPAGENADHPVADPASERILLWVDQPRSNHNGGQVLFGPDGYLWIGLGDGGGGGDPERNGQNPNSLLGKLLRIDVDGGDPYAIPGDNPYAAGGGLPEIWAIGLRNPWRFTFDRVTGGLYIADVGQQEWEEVNYLSAGSPSAPVNFGWNVREGAHPYSESMGAVGLIDPVFEYGHAEGCSITGGMVYRGKALPQYAGVYLFGDYCSGTIWGLVQQDANWVAKVLFQTNYQIASFGEDPDGEIYLLDLNGGVYRLAAQ